MPLLRRKVVAKAPLVQKSKYYHSSHYTVRNVRYLKKVGLRFTLVQILRAMIHRTKKEDVRKAS